MNFKKIRNIEHLMKIVGISNMIFRLQDVFETLSVSLISNCIPSPIKKKDRMATEIRMNKIKRRLSVGALSCGVACFSIFNGN